MKFIVVAVLLTSLSCFSNAAFINASDISELTVETPDRWSGVNESALFDGVTHRKKSTRFIGYRNNGDELSTINPFSFMIELAQVKTITDFSFYNDWGNHLNQQVMDMTVSFYDGESNGSNLNRRFNFSNLALNSFDEVVLFSNESIENTRSIVVDITKIGGKNFEIRELVFSGVNFLNQNDVQEDDTTNVSSPLGMLIVVVIAAGIVLRLRRSN